jgi:ribosomal-protein-alanine N-acetyltransferase
MKLDFSLLDEPAAREIVRWCYEPPYDVYNIEDTENSISYALDRQNNFYAIRDDRGELVGFCSFGKDGQVPGGDYVEPALDIGMGIRPDRTGQGRGGDFVAAVLDFAQGEFTPEKFRVTIAAFNQRAQRIWEKNGFHPTQRFVNINSNREFVVMIKLS